MRRIELFIVITGFLTGCGIGELVQKDEPRKSFIVDTDLSEKNESDRVCLKKDKSARNIDGDNLHTRVISTENEIVSSGLDQPIPQPVDDGTPEVNASRAMSSELEQPMPQPVDDAAPVIINVSRAVEGLPSAVLSYSEPRMHQKFRTTVYPRGHHTLYLNCPPLLIPETAEQGTVFRFQLSQSSKFGRGTIT